MYTLVGGGGLQACISSHRVEELDAAGVGREFHGAAWASSEQCIIGEVDRK